MCQPRTYAICFALFAFAPLLGCELVADFDRKLIPVDKTDAGSVPVRDAASDQDADAEDAGAAER
jgi:hypothetical protein